MPSLRSLQRDAYAWVNNGARRAAANIMNGLAEAGPEWSGEFKDSWVASTPDGQVGGGSYPYSTSELPELAPTKREAMRKKKYFIQNVAAHASIALDLENVPREYFRSPGFGPQGEVVARGMRPENGRRGEVIPGKGNARSTAPLDWYPLYINGGKMQKALERGVQLAKS